MNNLLSKNCLTCGKTFYKKPSKSKSIWLKQCKYCSFSCYVKSRKKYCLVCGMLSPIRSKGRYKRTCSNECARILQSRNIKKSKENLSESELSRLRKMNYEQSLHKKPTSLEIILYGYLDSIGVLYEKQKFINKRFCVDAYIPSENLVIEADGKYWHSIDKTIKKDRAENAYLAKCGYKMLRLSEDNLKDKSFISLINKNSSWRYR